MEPQNTSSHHLLPSGFPAASFPAQFAGINTNNSNVSSPLFMSTLQQLSGFSGTAAAAAGFLQSSTKLPLANQFPADVQWNPQQATWFDPTKMAAMLPMYGVLQSAVVGENALGSISVMEQNLKNQASLAAAVCTPTTLEALRFAQKSFEQATNSITPEAHDTPMQGVPISPARRANSRLQSTPAPASIASSPMPSSAGHITPQSCGYSASTSHPASNEMLHADSPIEIQHRNFSTHGNQFSPKSPHKNPMQVSTPHYSFPSSLNASKNSSEQILQSNNHAEVFRMHANKDNNKSGMENVSNVSNTKFEVVQKEQAQVDDLSMLEMADFEAFMGKDALNALESFSHPNQQPGTSKAANASRPTIPSQLNITPRKRNHREEELAHVDKELDRLVSLAAKKDARLSFLPFESSSYLKHPIAAMASTSTQAKLKPVNFTPPESPTRNSDDDSTKQSKHSTSEPLNLANLSRPIGASNLMFGNLLSGPSASTSQSLHKCNPPKPTRPAVSQTPSTKIFAQRHPSTTSLARPTPSASVQPLLFIPKQQTNTSKLPVYRQSNKVPVYKQRASNLLPTVFEKKSDDKPKIDDTFSFTDDEEEESQLLPTIAKPPMQQNMVVQKVDEDTIKKIVDLPIKVSKENKAEPKKIVEEISPTKVGEVVSSSATSKVQHKTSIAGQIRLRQKKTVGWSFVQSESSDDTAAAASSTASLTSNKNIQPIHSKCEEPYIIKLGSPCPSKTSNEGSANQEEAKFVPKLVIKIKRESEELLTERHVEKHKKKKKRKHKDRDYEWEGSENHKKKKKKHKHKKEHRRKASNASYEAYVVSDDDDDEMRKSSDASFSRKRRSIGHWEDGCNDSEMPDSFASTSRSGAFEEFVNSRLSQFGMAHGDLPKGTFVVAKVDIFNPDCALWRIDNQNLLQKFPPVANWNNKTCYKNSSTYSGWCDQIAEEYLTVGVKYHKQSRVETIVEPEIPITDLFPAITEELPIQNGVGDDTIEDEHIQDSMQLTKDVLRSHIKTFVNALLQHTISMNFLQSVKQGNDWNYLCALNEVEKMNASGKQKVKERVKWIERFAAEIEKYAEFLSFDNECLGLGELCQACGIKKVTKVAQLFHLVNYNYETLEIIAERDSGSGSPIQAIEFLICSSCANLASMYHKLHHMRFIVFKRCEDKMENVSVEKPDLSPDALIQLCMSKRTWLNQIVNEYVEIWKRVQLNDL